MKFNDDYYILSKRKVSNVAPCTNFISVQGKRMLAKL